MNECVTANTDVIRVYLIYLFFGRAVDTCQNLLSEVEGAVLRFRRAVSWSRPRARSQRKMLAPKAVRKRNRKSQPTVQLKKRAAGSCRAGAGKFENRMRASKNPHLPSLGEVKGRKRVLHSKTTPNLVCRVPRNGRLLDKIRSRVL